MSAPEKLTIETPEQVAETIATALRYVPAARLFPCTNCGLAPMRREGGALSCRRQRALDYPANI